MPRHFEQELQSLTTTLIKMGSLAEDAIRTAIRALLETDPVLAKHVIDGDERINSLEIEIDNAIIDLLALQQPVAGDLRMILSAQKINNDLERIGDHAVNIAESALTIAHKASPDTLLELPKMTEIAKAMLLDALDSFIHLNPDLARTVLRRDDDIDNLNRLMTAEVVDMLKKGSKTVEEGLELIRVSRNLERVGDLATNIAEEVIFLTQARVVKHHAEEKGTKRSDEPT